METAVSLKKKKKNSLFDACRREAHSVLRLKNLFCFLNDGRGIRSQTTAFYSIITGKWDCSKIRGTTCCHLNPVCHCESRQEEKRKKKKKKSPDLLMIVFQTGEERTDCTEMCCCFRGGMLFKMLLPHTSWDSASPNLFCFFPFVCVWVCAQSCGQPPPSVQTSFSPFFFF